MLVVGFIFYAGAELFAWNETRTTLELSAVQDAQISAATLVKTAVPYFAVRLTVEMLRPR